jgi:integrase
MKPRKNRSGFASKRYDNLYRYPDRPGWYYRKYSKAKRRTFVYSTGFDDEAEAYKAGVKAFDEWLGTKLEPGRKLIRDFARIVLASKELAKGGKEGATYRSAENQIMNHILPHFGHLPPAQFTASHWELYNVEERKRVYHREGKKNKKTGKQEKVAYRRTALANTRKYLIEILRKAHDEGIIERVPKLKNFDPKAKGPKAIPKDEMLRILRRASRNVKLLAFIMWKQGARPGEVLQYRWEMIDWKDGPTGTISIPGAITKTGRDRKIPLNSSVARILRWLYPRSNAPWIFPGADPAQPFKNYRADWDRACTRVNLSYEIYNCRDTFITNCLKRGLSETFIGKYCDTSPKMIAEKYADASRGTLSEVAG